ncbi:hypothetical protein M432DRAFT_677676 [Thermoascus aurantiacus ATCC 26904]
MKFTTSAVLAITGLFTATETLACCFFGCYAVKGSAYKDANCPAHSFIKSSIANWLEYGDCIDVSNAASIAAFNDGCGYLHPEFHFWNTPGCPGGPDGGTVIRKNGGGECFLKPEGAVSMLVVSSFRGE